MMTAAGQFCRNSVRNQSAKQDDMQEVFWDDLRPWLPSSHHVGATDETHLAEYFTINDIDLQKTNVFLLADVPAVFF